MQSPRAPVSSTSKQIEKKIRFFDYPSGEGIAEGYSAAAEENVLDITMGKSSDSGENTVNPDVTCVHNSRPL